MTTSRRAALMRIVGTWAEHSARIGRGRVNAAALDDLVDRLWGPDPCAACGGQDGGCYECWYTGECQDRPAVQPRENLTEEGRRMFAKREAELAALAMKAAEIKSETARTCSRKPNPHWKCCDECPNYRGPACPTCGADNPPLPGTPEYHDYYRIVGASSQEKGEGG